MGTHQGKSSTRSGEIRAALVSGPVGEDFSERDAAPELRAVFAVHGKQHVFRAHRGAHPDMGGFVTGAGRVGAQLAGALQVDGLGVEHPAQHHHPVHLHHVRRIGSKRRQWARWLAIRAEQLLIANGKLRDGLQFPRLPLRRIQLNKAIRFVICVTRS